MAALRIFIGFCFVFVVHSADHYERRTRYSRRSSLTDSELRNKLDSIISLIGKLNDKIDEQEQRIAVLSRKVTSIDCNAEPPKGTLNMHLQPCKQSDLISLKASD